MTSGELDATEVLTKLISGLESNGEMDVKTKDRLVLLALTSILTIIAPIPKRMHMLEELNIIIWIRRHPKMTGFLATVSTLFVMFLHQISPWVMRQLSFLSGLPH